MTRTLIQKILLGILAVTALCSFVFFLYSSSEKNRLAEEAKQVSKEVRDLNKQLPEETDLAEICEEYAQLSEQLAEKISTLQRIENTNINYNARKAAAEEDLRALQEKVDRFGKERLDALGKEYDELLAEYNTLNERYLALLGEAERGDNE